MINEETSSTMNRAELIKQARESCAKGLIETNTNSNKSSSVRRNLVSEEGKEKEFRLKIKFLCIRFVIALVILTAVIIIDRANFTYEGYSSQSISNKLESNDLYEQAKTLVASFSLETKKNKNINSKNDSSKDTELNQETLNENVLSNQENTDEISNQEETNEKNIQDETDETNNKEETNETSNPEGNNQNKE